VTDSVVSLRGGDATERAARLTLKEGAVVHLATHGRLNPDNPLFSRMELYPGDGRRGDLDGRLEAHEVLTMRVDAPLVYLSGCETGVGPTSFAASSGGAEYLSLAQVFLYAGAGGVVATSWSIPDRGSVPVVEAFYRHFRVGGPLAALAQAQRDVLRDPAHRHPYYWAGHVYSGDRLDPAKSGSGVVKRSR
jgi:CHAT domain-containing protein